MSAKKKSNRSANRGRTARNRQTVERAIITDEGGRLRAVERTVDTVELLHKRRQIDQRQFQAALLYRDAVDACRGSIPCPLDMSRVRGGAGAATAPSPTEAQLHAAERLADAARLLGLADTRLLSLVIADGWTLQKVAARLYGERRADAEHTGRRFRTALEALADAWVPVRRAATIRAHRTPAAVEQGAAAPITSGTVERALAAHATRRQVFYM